MEIYSTNQAAKKLGITGAALSKYVKAGKVPAPKVVQTGWKNVHAWSEEDIAKLRELLPKIANGRKTRHIKQQSTKSKAKSKKPPPGAAVPHKQSSKKKK